MGESYEPMKFIDRLYDRKHIVLFYEEPEYGRAISFRFVNNGLLKEEHSIYATEEDTKFVENEMIDYGIDVEGFKRKSLLHLYQVSNPMDDPEGLSNGVQKIRNRIFADSKPPYRVVSRMIPSVNTKEQMTAIVDLERTDQSNFDKFQGSLLCPFYIGEIEHHKHARRMVDVLQNHHAAIFAPQLGKGIGFNMR